MDFEKLVGRIDAVSKLDRLSWDEYVFRPEMNASKLVLTKKSMLAMKNAIDGNAVEPTPAMSFGTKYHTMNLEPREFGNRYCVMPNFAAMEENKTAAGKPSDSWRCKFAKESKDAFIKEAEEKNMGVVTREEYERGLSMVQAIWNNRVANTLVQNLEKEVTIFGDIGGVKCKSRLDLCGSVIADIKGTSNASAHRFGRDAANLHYAFKLAFYRELYRQNFGFNPAVFIIAVESAGDFECAVYEVPRDMLEDKLVEVKVAMARYVECIETESWPGVDGNQKSPIPLFVPNWAMDQDPDEGLNWEEVE